MCSAVRVISITALFIAFNLLTLGNQQDSLRELIRTTQDEETRAMLYLKLSEVQKTDRLDALKEAENIFKSNTNNTVGIETYLQLGNYFLSHTQPDSAIFYFEKALYLSELLNDRFYTARANQELGKYYLQQGNLLKACEYAQDAKTMFSAMKDTFWLLQQSNFLAGIEIEEGNIPKGKRLYDEVIRKGLSERDADAIALANYELGKIYLSHYNYSDAFQSFRTSKNIWEESDNSTNLAKIQNKLGAIYIAIGLDSLAYIILNESLDLNSENDPDISAETYLNLSEFYLSRNNFNEALSSVNNAISLANSNDNTFLYLSGIIKKANIFCIDKDFTESKNLIEGILPEIQENKFPGLKAEGLEIYSRVLLNLSLTNEASSAAAAAYEEANNNNNLEQIQKTAFILGQLMNERGQFISASRFLLLSNQYKDSLAIGQNDNTLKNTIYQYELANNQAVAGTVNDLPGSKRNNIFNKAGANNRIQNLLLISIVLLVILISFFSVLVFKGYRSSKKLYNDLKPGKAKESKNSELEKLAVLNNKIFSVISHDLRSPIISIKDSIDFLRQEDLDEETKRETLILSEELTEATLNLLDNLLGWAKNQKKQIEPKKLQVKILDEIKQIEYLYKASIIKKEINFTIECKNDVSALADTELINLALRNLVSNAVKFTPRGGNIHIAGETFEDHVLISVKDTGIGIPKEDQMKILSPDLFFTKNGTENESGSGIGLKLVNEFIKIMGGELKIESSPGQGSKFIFTLPAFPAKKNPKSTETFFKHTIN